MAQVVLWLALILVTAKLGGDLAARIGQPSVLGELVVGVVLGNLTLVGFDGLEALKHDAAIIGYVKKEFQDRTKKLPMKRR